MSNDNMRNDGKADHAVLPAGTSTDEGNQAGVTSILAACRKAGPLER
jgi:hypothetical protein